MTNGVKAQATVARYVENQCALYTDNYVYLAISAALTGLVAAGQLPDDYDILSGQLDKLIGTVVAEIVKTALGDPNSPLHYLANELPPGWLAKLNQYIADGATDKIIDLLKQNPVTAQFIGFFNCGAVVATSGIADQAKQILINNPKSCSVFLGTCSKSIAACIGGVANLGEDIALGVANLPVDLIEAYKAALKGAVKTAKAAADAPAAAGVSVECDIGTPCLTPGVQQEQCKVVVDCPAGTPYGQCAAAGAKASCANTQITCSIDGGGFFATLKGVSICKCPDPQGYIVAGGKPGKCAVCPPGQAVDNDNGQCRAGKANEVLWSGYWKACVAGEKAYPEFGLCGPVCDAGLGQKIARGSGDTLYCQAACAGVPNGVYDPVWQQCRNCTKDKAVAGGGICNVCANGTKFDYTKVNGARCIPSCAFGSVIDPLTGKCSSCGPTKIALYKDGSNKTSSAGSCQACKATVEKIVGNTCVPALDCESWQKLEARGAVPACVNRCPAGQKYTAVVKGSAGGIQTDKLGNKIGMAPVVGSPCKVCNAGTVLDPLTNECNPCSGNTVWTAARDGNPAFCAPRPGIKPNGVPNSVVPVRPSNKLPTEKKGTRAAPVGSCPPGRVRNAAGTQCIVDIDNDGGFRGGSGAGGGRPAGAAAGRSGGGLPAPVFRSPITGGKP